MSRIIEPNDAEWPRMLAEADAMGVAPPVTRLYATGLPLDPDRRHVAIVGTRRASATGLDLAFEFGARLSEAGFTIVSGLALGIDGAAHKGALEADGRSVAVLGCGVDVCYPGRHRGLRDRLLRQGTILSEYPDGTPPDTWRFPQRNRIIAALSTATIVVQGGRKSGALITAEYAFNYDRRVVAVPGNPLCRESDGCHYLIRSSTAALVTSVDEVLEELAPELTWADADIGGSEPSPQTPVPAGLREGDLSTLAFLDDVPRPPMALALRADRPTGDVALGCARLEVRGLAAKRMAGFVITPAGIRVCNSVVSRART